MEVKHLILYKLLVVEKENNQMVSLADSVDGGLFLPLLPRFRVENVLYRASNHLRNETLTRTELSNILEKASVRILVFPSHFFEYQEKNFCLSELKRNKKFFWVQITPGAELQTYFHAICSLAESDRETFLGVELLLDRAPHQKDKDLIEALYQKNVFVRYVFCPTNDIDPILAIKNFPRAHYNDLYLYFPKNENKWSTFYTPDEAFVFLLNLKEAVPELSPLIISYHFSISTNENPSDHFLQKPSVSSFDAIAGTKEESGIRSSLRKISRVWLLWPIILIPYGIILFYHHPKSAILVPKKYGHRFCIWMYYFFHRRYHNIRLAVVLSYHFFRKNYFNLRLLAIHAYYFLQRCASRVRHAFIMITLFIFYKLILGFYYKVLLEGLYYNIILRGFYFILQHLFYNGLLRTYYFLYHMGSIFASVIAHPIWASKQYFSPLYWVVFFPVLKAYWFIKFQIQKRVLKTNIMEQEAK